jgi:hypothetical protein
MMENNEMERMWKEVVLAKFKLSLPILTEKTEESHEKPHSRQLVFWPLFEVGTSRIQVGRCDS